MKLRKLAALGGALLLTGTLAACGNGAQVATPAPEAPVAPVAPLPEGGGEAGGTGPGGCMFADGPVTLTVWESLLGPDQFVQEAGQRFTAMHPNVTVNYVNVELGDAAVQISLDGPAGVGADVFAAPHDTLGALVQQGLVLPVADPAALQANALGFSLDALTSDGTLYGFPMAAETYAMFYNRDLIDTPPTTFDGLIEFAQEFNATHPGQFGYVMDVGNFYYTFMFMTMGGNRLFGPYGTNADDPEINTPESVQGFTHLQELREILPIAAGDLTTDAVDGLFQAGNAAILLSGPWNISRFEDAGLNFGVAPIFSLPGQTTPAISFSGVRAMFVSAFSEHPCEAQAFAEFLTTPEIQQLRVDITGAMSISTGNINYANPAIDGFAAQLEHSFAMPSIPRMAAVWDTLNTASANIWDGANPQSELDAATDVVLAHN